MGASTSSPDAIPSASPVAARCSGSATRRAAGSRISDPRFDDQSEVDVVDVDGDGRPDIVATLFADSLQGRLFVFLAPSDPVAEPWTAVEIDPGPLWGVHSQAVAGFDGSSRVQVMIG